MWLLALLFSSSVLAESEVLESPAVTVVSLSVLLVPASRVLRVCCVARRRSGWLCPPDGPVSLCKGPVRSPLRSLLQQLFSQGRSLSWCVFAILWLVLLEHD